MDSLSKDSALVTGVLDIKQRSLSLGKHKYLGSIGNRIGSCASGALTLGQNIYRSFAQDEFPGVYYPEYSINRHPRLRYVMYGSRAPLLWSSRQDAALYHFVNRPIFIPSARKQGFVLEPNDHILSFCNTFVPHLPAEAIKNASVIFDNLIEKGLRGLLVNPRTGLIQQLGLYLPDYAKDLLLPYEDARCVNRVTVQQLLERQRVLQDLSYSPRICVLAAGWIAKHISALVYAYVNRPRKAHLTLCVPDLPRDLELLLSESGNSYSVIRSAPLSCQQKHSILEESDISVSLTSIDGGSNALEGMEYGHAIITNRYHRTAQFANTSNAIIVQMGSNYYDLGSWGIEWQNVQEFVRHTPYLRDPLNRQYLDDFISQLDESITTLLGDRDLLASLQYASLDMAYKRSCEVSNQAIRNTYIDLVGKASFV
jgi:hypothetical protein